MDTPLHRALAVKAWLEQGSGQRTLAFCAGVAHAEHLAQDFRALGVSAQRIDGKTKNRQELLQRFRAEELQVLTNYGVLTESFDDLAVLKAGKCLEIGEEHAAMQAKSALKALGYFANVAVYPAVPRGRAGLRIMLNCHHELDDVRRLGLEAARLLAEQR